MYASARPVFKAKLEDYNEVRQDEQKCDSVSYNKNGWEFSSGGKVAKTVKDTALI